MEVQLKQITCCSCGVIFWISASHHHDLVTTHQEFYCPNGHTQYFTTKTEEERYKQKCYTLRARQEELNDRHAADGEKIAKLKRSIIAHKGAIGSLKKRIQK